MIKMKKFLALGLAAVMTLTIMACGGKDAEETSGVTTSGGNEETSTAEEVKSYGPRDINIGTWWLPYYDSSHSSVEDDPTYSGLDIAHSRFDNLKAVESKYNIKLYFQNLTYEGVQESLNTSVLAGSPDMDIYLCNINFGVPAVMNGLTIDLKTLLPAGHDVLTSQINARYLDLGDGTASLFGKAGGEAQVENTYVLGFNKQMLEANNLESPVDLWERGAWTWDKFVEYLIILTQDTTGDGQINQWGYCGYFQETLTELLMSNGTQIAGGGTENLSSSEVGEVLQLMYDMYNVHNVAYPYDMDTNAASSSMRGQYREGNIAFFPITQWIANNGDYDATSDNALNFDTVYVRWPVGPNGNKDTNAGKRVVDGEWYVLPAGLEDPLRVFDVIYDYWNWYDLDVTVRDDRENMNWWYTTTAYEEDLREQNFGVTFDASSIGSFDLWSNLGIENLNASFNDLFAGLMTPAQLQETHKNQYQEALNAIFK